MRETLLDSKKSVKTEREHEKKRMMYKQTQTKILMIIMMELEPSMSTVACIP